MAKIIKAYTPITAGIQEKDEVLVPMLIDEYIDKVGTGLVGPYICVVNESPISRKHWGSLVVQKNDIVLFLGFPQGGGEGGSNPMKAILTIALMGAALTVPGAAFAAGSFFAAGFGGALVSGTIMFGGSYLLNLAFPPSSPAQESLQSTKSGSSLSSYNINDRGNNSALGNVITVQYGRIKHYPKFAMLSYSKYIANEQYAYLLFCQGQGEFSFEEYNFGTVSSTDIDDISIGIFHSNAILPWIDGEEFRDNVFTSDQVENTDVKRVSDYRVTVPGAILPELTVAAGDDLLAGYFQYNFQGIGLEAPSSAVYNKYNIYSDDDTILISGFPSYSIITKSGSASYALMYDTYPRITDNPPLLFPVGTVLSSILPSLQKALWIHNTDTIPSGVTITSPSGQTTLLFEDGMWGPIEFYDGFVAGDDIEVYNSDTAIVDSYQIKTSSYFTAEIAGLSTECVAYEFIDPVPAGYIPRKGSYVDFVPDSTSTGYIVPNTYSVIDKFEVDVLFPNGIYKINQTTGDPETTGVNFDIEYKIISDTGVEDSTWTVGQTVELEKALKDPIYETYSVTLPSSASSRKLRVRLNRNFGTVNEFPNTSNTISNMYFGQLKVFLENTNYYGDVTMIAAKVKVSNSLVQASLSKFNTVSTRKLPVYTTSWSANTATRNPAWAIADACRNSEYSLGIPDADIDIDELVSLAAIWESREDYCDGLFENKEVFWDALRKICKVGRAQPLMVAGAVGLVRDQPKTIPIQVFSSDNIQFGSFNVDYIPFDDDTPNSVEMEYFDEEEWVWKKTLQTIPGGDTTKPASIQQWGITTEDHAIREAKYESACNAYRRKLPNFTTELEGRILKRLDYISVSSPRVGWGISGHIINVDGNELELSEPVEFVSGSYYIAFREKNGSQDGPYLVTEVVDSPKKVLMGVTPPSFIYTGYEYEKTHFQFGQGDSYDRKALVSTVQPQQLESVQITCIIDDERVYTADGTTGV